jgi:ParB family chromosome partitioning protein
VELLEGIFGSGISIKSSPKGRNKIVIEFSDDRDVERFIEKFTDRSAR